MEKMKLETPDLTAQNIEKIGALFPNCVTETVDENGKLCWFTPNARDYWLNFMSHIQKTISSVTRSRMRLGVSFGTPLRENLGNNIIPSPVQMELFWNTMKTEMQ